MIPKRIYYNEPYRPQFHYTPVKNWMNDPNGLVYYKGLYHLFYQYNPRSNVPGPQHWGHAVSDNLVNWLHLPIALYPDEQGVNFSGSAVVDCNDSTEFFNRQSGLAAIYTGVVDCSSDRPPLQQQNIAYGKNNEIHLIKYARNPVIPNPGIQDFRDPKVLWYERDKKWVMVVACGDRVKFYHSANLKDWTYLSDFGAEQGAHGGAWECPDLFELPIVNDSKNKKWVLKVDLDKGAHTGGSGGQYFIGHFDGKEFHMDTPDAVYWLDYGKDFYAAQSWFGIPNENTRRIWIAWMNNWEYAAQTPTYPWRGAMTIPREVTLKNISGEIKLLQKPVTELKTLRKSCQIMKNMILRSLPRKLRVFPFDIHSKCLEIIAEFELGTAASFGFRVLKYGEYYTNIGYNTINQTLFVDRRRSGNVFFNKNFPGKYEVSLAPVHNKIKIHIFVDRSSVEVFGNDGAVVLTNLIFPVEKGTELELYVHNGTVKLNSLQIYPLKSIWA